MGEMGEIEPGADAVVDQGGGTPTGRRQAIKTGAGVIGVAAAAWAIPTISGVGVTPADAAIACSPNSVHRTVVADGVWPPVGVPAPMSWSFTVNSDHGGCTDPAAWTGTTNSHAFTAFSGTYYAQPVTITAQGPIGNVDNPCFQTVAKVTSVAASGATDSSSPFQYTITRDHIPVGANGTSCALSGADVQTKTYTLNCTVSMNVTSCPPLGISNDDACARAGAGGCSAALNGSGSGTVTVSCTSS
jgi:hypothetical protein